MTQRRTLAQHARHRSPSATRDLLKLCGVAVVVLLAAVAGVAGFTAWDWTSSYTGAAVDIAGQRDVPPDIGAIEGGIDILLVGTDECEAAYRHLFRGRCDGPDSDGILNDVNLLVHISEEPRRVTAISFPRDLMVPIPACTDPSSGGPRSEMAKQPLNSAWGHGGLDCVTRTVEELSTESIEYSAKITWGGVIEITNAIGGVTVCLASPISDDEHTGITWPAGERTIAGVDALEFLRTRYGVGDGSDLARIANQQQYMSRLARKVVSDEVLTNPATLFRLASTIVHNVTPSKTLTNPLTLVQIAQAVRSVPFDDIVFVQYPVFADPDDAAKVVPNRDAADVLWAALRANRPLRLTGPVGSGVVEQGADAASPSPSDATPPDDPASAAPPAGSAAILPGDIPGQTARQQTCSNGSG